MMPMPSRRIVTVLCIVLFLCGGTSARLSSYDFSLPGSSVASPSPHRSYSFLSNNDPFLGVKYHSGYFNIGKMGGEMFYWLFLNSENKTSMDTPFLLWMTGGPGCSSELAALTENGPLTVMPDATVNKNPFSWHQLADIVYVDQPLGTGFSSAGDPRNFVTNEKMVAEDMREFLVQFLDLFPTFKNKPFYITGESYAGHYIPAVAHSLLKKPIDALNFVGIAIGNGWVDPATQYPAYADFAFEHNMIGEAGYQLAKRAYTQCVNLLDKGLWPLALIQCNAITNGLLGKRNPYDIRLQCDVPPSCYNTTGLNNFMNRDDVQRALGVHKKWIECNMVVYSMLLGDWARQLRTKVGDVLNAGKKVLIYSGDQDFICNWRGGLAWLRELEWDKSEEFNSLEPVIWNVNNKPAGELRRVANLTFLRVFDAGHMVPMDQPASALAMMQQFLGDGLQGSLRSSDFNPNIALMALA